MATIALRGAIAAQLYATGALDPRVLVGAVAIFTVTALVACLGPARRAVRINPFDRVVAAVARTA